MATLEVKSPSGAAGEIKIAEPITLEIRKWGKGISDLRGFTMPIYSAQELEAFRNPKPPTVNSGVVGPYARPYIPAKVFDMQAAKASIAKTLELCEPGIIFAANPHYGTYAKWDCALAQSGFRQIGTCAVNPVYSREGYTWKGTKFQSKYGDYGESVEKKPWESPDGFMHWIHAFYYIKSGAKNLSLDFSKRNRSGGDNLDALFQVNYLGAGPLKKDTDGYEKAYARLSKNCGMAFGMDLPMADVHKAYFTIMAWPSNKILPKGWTRFAVVDNLKFAHNLALISDRAMPKCVHSMRAL